MVFSDDDKSLIKSLYLIKGYGPTKLMSEFPDKNWTRRGLEKLLKKVRETGTTDRKKGSGRPRSARTEQNVSSVEDLVLSQEGQPQTHRSIRQISREIGIHRSSVHRIIHGDLGLKCLKKRRAQELTQRNRDVRLLRAKQLLKLYPDDKISFIWFTDEKVFTVATPKNPQNDRLYVPAASKKKQVSAERLLRTRTTFSQSVMVSVGVSKLGYTDLIFVDPGVKINGAYYRDVLLSQQLLPMIRDVSGEFFIFQQDSAPAHRARDTVRYLEQDTPEFIPPDLWPPNSPDLNPVDYKIWSVVQQRVYQSRVHNINELKQRLLDVWHGMEQGIIDSAIDEWRRRLRACVRAKGGHFEQQM